MLGRRACADRRATGLDVDDDGAALGVDLEPVDPAPQAQRRTRRGGRRPRRRGRAAPGARPRPAAGLRPGWPAPSRRTPRACRARGRARGGRTTGRPRRAGPRPSAAPRPARRRPRPPPRPGRARAPSAPVTAASAPVSLPPWRSSTQRSGQRMIFSTSEGRHRDDGVGGPQRGVGGHRGGAVPVVRVGAGHPGLGQPGQLRRGPGASGGGGGGSGPSGAQTARRSSPTSSASTSARPGRCTGRSAWSAGSGSSSSRKREGCSSSPWTALTSRVCRGPGAGDVEQPALLGEQRRHPRHRGAGGLGDPREQVDEPLVAQQAAAQPQIGPRALLDAGHRDDVPLAAAGGVGREQLDGVARAGCGRPASRRGAAARPGTR